MSTENDEVRSWAPEVGFIADYDLNMLFTGTVDELKAGKVSRQLPLDRSPALNQFSPIKRTLYWVGDSAATVLQKDGSAFPLELAMPLAPDPRRGRKVVYLDQKDWSAISNVIYRPEDQSEKMQEAVKYLLSLVENEKVILPLSFAHVIETSQSTSEEKRAELALVLMKYSRNWQMPSPLATRKHELALSLSKLPKLGNYYNTFLPFSIEPGLVFRDSPSLITSSNMSDDMYYVLTSMVSLSVLIATLFHGEAHERGDVSSWVSSNATINQNMAALNSPKQKKNYAKILVLQDLEMFLEPLGKNLQLLAGVGHNWMMSFMKDDLFLLPDAPATYLFYEVLYGRYRNTGYKWKGNDLIDMFYLATAAAYADHTVGERSTISALRQITQKAPSKSALHLDIVELVAALRQEGL